ncbi:MAG: hypothetical protein EXS05_14545 [Planctomycetaceae bacterium]|nr:hypothetical protein [Planctomycetaceae bacterium]
MQTRFWSFAAILVIAASPVLSGERPTAEELLAAYEKSVEHLSHARIECVEKHPARPIGDNESISETHERSIVRDGSRWKVADVARMVQTSNGTKQVGEFHAELIAGAQQIHVGKTPDGTVQVSAVLDPTKVIKVGSSPEFVGEFR